jgi:hypothetical protein
LWEFRILEAHRLFEFQSKRIHFVCWVTATSGRHETSLHARHGSSVADVPLR